MGYIIADTHDVQFALRDPPPLIFSRAASLRGWRLFPLRWTRTLLIAPKVHSSHGAGTHSIEGKKWWENAEHIAQDIWGCSAFMLSKWDSYCRVDLGSPSQNFFRAPPARSAGKPMEHSYRYRLRFGTRSGCQNFRASFLGISKTSRRFSIGFLYNDLHRSWFPNPTPQQRNTQKDKHDRSLTLEM